jgi:hypothetical protein
MRRIWWWFVGAIALLAVVVVVGSRLVDEPLRRRIESGMNAALKGYKVRIGKVRFHPVGFSLDLMDGVIIQEANPDPPVANVPQLHASVEWLALLHGHLVADFRFDRPALHIDLRHAQQEAKEKVPVHERGWQEAALAAYPLKINLLRIVDGDITYAEKGPLEPIHLAGLDFRAGNIRNARSRSGEYPSDIHLHSKLQDRATLGVEGHADFFAIPQAAIKVNFDVNGVEIAWLEPILHHYDVDVRRGTLATRGEVEYGPNVQNVVVSEATVDSADVQYRKRRPGQPTAGEKAAQTAAKMTQEPPMAVHVERVKIGKSTLAYANETTDPAYHLFVTDCDLTLTNFSNVRGIDPNGPPGKVDGHARFMGSGPTSVQATFHPREDRTDFTIGLRIENTDMRTMNDLWRAYGSFEVEQGAFSLYSELAVEQGRVDGYVKPLITEFKVAGPKENEEAGVGKRIYHGIVGGVATVLKNPPRDQIATETRLSGPLENPKTSILQVLGGLVQNAFFKAILPGLKGRARE